MVNGRRRYEPVGDALNDVPLTPEEEQWNGSGSALKIKSVDDTGTFTGLGAAYNNVDLGGDKIVPGAFTRTLAAGKQFPLLWQHDPSSPIGTCKVTDTPQGLHVEGTLLLQDPTAQKATRS